jgi:hypothetical protein
VTGVPDPKMRSATFARPVFRSRKIVAFYAVPELFLDASDRAAAIVLLDHAHEAPREARPTRRHTGRKLHDIRPLESPELGGT